MTVEEVTISSLFRERPAREQVVLIDRMLAGEALPPSKILSLQRLRAALVAGIAAGDNR